MNTFTRKPVTPFAWTPVEQVEITTSDQWGEIELEAGYEYKIEVIGIAIGGSVEVQGFDGSVWVAAGSAYSYGSLAGVYSGGSGSSAASILLGGGNFLDLELKILDTGKTTNAMYTKHTGRLNSFATIVGSGEVSAGSPITNMRIGSTVGGTFSAATTLDVWRRASFQ